MLKNLSQDQLESLYFSAQYVSETMRVLQKSNTNIVGEILKTVEGENYNEWEHIPADDVYDRHSHSQYYYHVHEKDGGIHDDEHGHFHTFIRGKGMPDDVRPTPLNDYDAATDISEINTHIIGVGMNEYGIPMRFFTVNRWVTGETWVNGDDIITLLDNFEIDHVEPSWPLNLWLTHLIKLYRPHIEKLIKDRDIAITNHTQNNPGIENVYEDRNLEVTSYIDIDLASYVDELESYLSLTD